MEHKQKRWPEAGAALVAFGVFFLVALHGLTHSSLWMDEAVEFWYSRVMSGPLSFENGPHATYGMLQRINSTFQPPLYNLLMFVWLQFSQGEWWFRFSSVIIGFAGMLGFYCSVRRITSCPLAAAAAVLSASFFYPLLYYGWQECAEYALVMTCLFWAIYFWTGLLQKPSRRDLIGVTVLSVLSMYSQYGAVFPVFVMVVSSAVLVFREKKKELTRTLLVSYGCAFFLAALPLFFCFFLKQFTNQNGGDLSAMGSGLSVSSLLAAVGRDVTLSWQFLTSRLPGAAVLVLLLLLALVTVWVFIRSGRFLKRLLLCCLAVFLLYYLAVRLQLYAYGHAGGRYAVILYPFLLIACVAVLRELRLLLVRGKPVPGRVFTAVLACCLAAFCFLSWQLKLKDNWQKEDDIRLSASLWFAEQAAPEDTIVYYGSASSFAYYIRLSDSFSDEMESRLHYMNWDQRMLPVEDYRAYADSLWGDVWPDTIYIVSAHIGGDLERILAAVEQNGYEREYLNSWSLIRLTRRAQP